MLEEMVATYSQHGVHVWVPGRMEELYGPGRVYVELYGAQWFCTKLGHCGGNEPQHLVENWAVVQWRQVSTVHGPLQIWWLMLVEWVGDRWVVRYKSYCDFQEDSLGRADISPDVRCPPDPRADDISVFRRITLGWVLSSDDSNFAIW